MKFPTQQAPSLGTTAITREGLRTKVMFLAWKKFLFWWAHLWVSIKTSDEVFSPYVQETRYFTLYTTHLYNSTLDKKCFHSFEMKCKSFFFYHLYVWKYPNSDLVVVCTYKGVKT